MSLDYYTVIFRVDGDKAVQDAWWQSLRPLFLADGSPPVSIIGIATGDLMARTDELTRQLQDDLG
jgi:hypothetical protein